MDTPQYSSAPSNINCLPNDLLLDKILSTLPFRYAVQCKVVSNQWLALISSTRYNIVFLCAQLAQFNAFFIFLMPNEVMLTFLPNGLGESPNSYLIKFDRHSQNLLYPDILVKRNICGSSGNLLLCCDKGYNLGSGYYLCDPHTKQCTHIPSPPSFSGSNRTYAVGFVHRGGETRSFRVVLIGFFRMGLFDVPFLVFSSETWQWEVFYYGFPLGIGFGTHSLSFEGSLYFMCSSYIFVYDPYTRDRRTIQYPDPHRERIMRVRFLGISSERLRIADIGPDDVSVWRRVPEIDGWNLEYTKSLTENLHLPAEFCNNSHKRVVGFHPYDENILYLHSYDDGTFAVDLLTDQFDIIPGNEKTHVSPFQLVLPLSPPPMP
ncbi:uncharacterized protein LOC133296814 [Gastrolobium bilobum]|uniref:uncharacterized protein LOC133296814 n=1 Tax=Gastrolobium bilobum TaxID=150636 RepID=UPI002AB208BE|nr:uncharacterized protein LOC133296814 [Gastrolobium bilobum]